MLASARDYIERAWWVVSLPGLTILLSVLAINLMGDGLRDALDPKLKNAAEEIPMSLLEIKNLNVRFGDKTAVPVVDGLDISVDKGEVLAIVGESGSGKSVTMMALMGLIEHPGIVTADALRFDGKDMLKLSARQRRQVVGKDLAMVFQDPMTALNPSYTVGFQIEEVLRLHLKMSGKAARKRAIELLEKVEIRAPPAAWTPTRTNCPVA